MTSKCADIFYFYIRVTDSTGQWEGPGGPSYHWVDNSSSALSFGVKRMSFGAKCMSFGAWMLSVNLDSATYYLCEGCFTFLWLNFLICKMG